MTEETREPTSGFDSGEEDLIFTTVRPQRTPEPSPHAVRYFDRFRLERVQGKRDSLLGRGGMGEVHLAIDEWLGREVALKLARAEISRDKQARSDMKKETRAALELTHPNIVRIYDYHESEEHWGISMQLVHGKSISDMRAERSETTRGPATLTPEELIPWLGQLCEAISFAHEYAGMVHRDINPRNLMIEKCRDSRDQPYERLLVTDFGITEPLRHTLQRTMPQAEIELEGPGTRPYICPQQLMDRKAHVTDDIYSIGATLYDLLTGRPPYLGRDLAILMDQIKNESVVPPPVNQRRLENNLPELQLPENWETVIASCLEKRPEKRPQSARELSLMLGLNPDRVFETRFLESERELIGLRKREALLEERCAAAELTIQELRARGAGAPGAGSMKLLLYGLISAIAIGALAGWVAGVLGPAAASPLDKREPPGVEAEAFVSGLDEMKFAYLDKGLLVSSEPVSVGQFKKFLSEVSLSSTEEKVNAHLADLLALPDDLPVQKLNDDEPIQGVSWFFADAFCQWWTQAARIKGNIRETQRYRLPSREEYEKKLPPADGLEFWCGDEPDREGDDRLKRTVFRGKDAQEDAYVLVPRENTVFYVVLELDLNS